LKVSGESLASQAPVGGLDSIRAVRKILLRVAAAIELGPIGEEIRSVCYQVPALDTDSSLRVIEAFRSALASSNHDNTLSDSQVHFVRMLQFFAYRRPLFVISRPIGPLTRISYENEISPHELRLDAVRENFRAFFGRLPDDHFFQIPHANKTQSYHFRLRAPESHYVRSATCFRRLSRNLALGRRVRPWEVTEFDPGSRLAAGLIPNADGICHVHLADLKGQPEARRGLLLRVRFAERPPGQIAVSLSWLLIALAACAYIARYGSAFVARSGTPLFSLLLGLPGLLGIATFISSSARTRGPLLARFCALIASSASIGLALTLLSWTTTASHQVPLPKEFDATAGVKWSLAAIAVVLSVMAIWAANALRRNRRRYREATKLSISQRRDSETNV
jgi:hypothetical protein